MSHVSLAISPARKPALADSSTMTRLRSGLRVQSAKIEEIAEVVGRNILACRPAMRVTLMIKAKHYNKKAKQLSTIIKAHQLDYD